MSDHTKNADCYLDLLLEIDLLERTIKESQNSPLQQYVVTMLGREVLNYIMISR